MGETTAKLRQLWKAFACKEGKMVLAAFGPDRIRVAPGTETAWEALASALHKHQYDIRTADTDSYNCRNIKGTNQKSLHSYGIALDVNWTTNPFLDHAGKRKVRFSDKPTQVERAEDVRLGRADTDMTPEMIADVMAIKTLGSKRVFDWGGTWTTTKDCMHFEIDVSPAELGKGIDPSTVSGWNEFQLAFPDPMGEIAVGEAEVSASVTAGVVSENRYVVIAREGMNLRAGPSTDFKTLGICAPDTELCVISREGPWALVDLRGDGKADGYVVSGFLRPAGPALARAMPEATLVMAAPTAAGILERVTVDMISHMFPRTRKANISANLPFVIAGLRSRNLDDRRLVLMALATIRAETEGFVPISEGISRYNTQRTPFDLYDAGTPKGRRLGNAQRGDGPRFKGRGYVQLTGRDNYTRVGGEIGAPLTENPELANDPTTAGVILAQFLKNKLRAILDALARNDLRTARKLVNGGSHGFDRFKDAFDRGSQVLPV